MKSTALHIFTLLILSFSILALANASAPANLSFYGVWIGAGPDAIITKVSSLPFPLTLTAWQYTNTLIVWEHTDYPCWLTRQFSSRWCTGFLARNGAGWVRWCVPERDHESGWRTRRVVFVAVLLLQVRLHIHLHFEYFVSLISWSDNCNSPATNLTAQMRGKSKIGDGVWEEFLADGWLVWPGDSVKNVFSLDIPTGKWYNNWVVTPGQQGNAAGQKPFGGGFVFDPAVDSESPFTQLHEKTC
jgi:hypothetical protein